MTSTQQQAIFTQKLLSQGHDKEAVERIWSEKIQHRPLFLRPSSPPPTSGANGREARRKARRQKLEQRSKTLKPKPLSARQRRALGLYNIPRERQKYELYEPLHQLWLGYICEILGNDLYGGANSGFKDNSVASAAAKLTSADFHGAVVDVTRSKCVSRVGIKGIVVKDSKFAFEIITEKHGLKLVPKEGTVFRVEVAVPDASPRSEGGDRTPGKGFVFEILGDQCQERSAERATKKMKSHFLKCA